MSERSRAGTRIDLGLAAFALIVAALLWFGTAGLPPPRFEPMGSAALPRVLAGLIAALAGLVAWKAWRARPSTASALKARPASARLRLLAVPAALAAYVAALDFGRAPFVVTTVVLVIAMGLLLSRPTLRTALAFAALGLVLALVIDTVFTRFLYVDLG